MSKVLITEQYLRDIANAIRERNGSRETYTPAEMADAIRNIGALPAYWRQALDEAAATINSLRAGIEMPFSSVFVTDVHLEDNSGRSPELIRELMLRTGVSSAVCGGDLITRQSTKEAAEALLAGWVTRTRGLQMVNLLGNHDLNSEPEGDGAGRLRYAEWFELMGGSADNVSWYTRNGEVTGFGYRDHAAVKIRELFLNTGAPAEDGDDYHFASGLAWAYDGLKSLGSDWGVLIYAHKYWQPTGHMSEQNPAAYLRSYLKARAGQISAQILAMITGHCHDDYSAYDPDLGYLIVSTTCDAGGAQALLDEVHPTRTPGTAQEQAFDVITVDRGAGKLHLTRIGAGESRSLSYYHMAAWPITAALTNVSSSNGASSADNGAAYSTTLTPSQGCTMQLVRVRMGGTDVTEAVYTAATGSVDIAAVTGAVEITAIAEAERPVWTNLVPSALGTDGGVYNGSGYKNGKYLSNTTGTFEGGDDAEFVLTGRIPYSKAQFDAGAVIVVSGLDWTEDEHCRMAFCSSLVSATSNPYCKGSATAAGAAANISTYFELKVYEDYWTLTPKPGTIVNEGMLYLACSLRGSGAALSIGVV